MVSLLSKTFAISCHVCAAPSKTHRKAEDELTLRDLASARLPNMSPVVSMGLGKPVSSLSSSEVLQNGPEVGYGLLSFQKKSGAPSYGCVLSFLKPALQV